MFWNQKKIKTSLMKIISLKLKEFELNDFLINNEMGDSDETNIY